MTAESEAHLTLVMKAKNMASGEISKTKGALKDLKTGALDGLNLGFAGVAGAAALLTGALIKGVQGAVEEEAQLKRLQTAISENATAWDGNMKSVTDAVHAREGLGFTDSALRESLIKLVPATHDVNKALDYQKTAMDLARLKGISLEDASQALVKVEGGQYRMLKQLGIVLDDGATQTEALAAVQKVAMGQAAAYADTLAGKTEVLQARLDDLTENVGGLLIPALSDLADTTLKVIDVFDTDSPTTLGDRLKNLTDVVNTLNPATWGMNQAFDGARKEFAKADARAADAALTMDTYAEANAAAREPINKAREANNKLNKSLAGTAESGAAALQAVNDQIDALYELDWIARNGKAQPKGFNQHGAIGAQHNAAGGWVGLNGPELSWVGEQGPEYIVPNHELGRSRGGGGAGVMLQGVTEAEIMAMVDRGLFFRLRRAAT